MSEKTPHGFEALLEHKRLDLTIEAVVLRGPWKHLFADHALEKARERLRIYGRPDLAEV